MPPPRAALPMPPPPRAALPMPLIHGPWPFAPILPPPTMPRLSAGIIDPPGMGLGSVAIGGTTIGGAPSAVALGAEPPRKRTNGQRGPDRRKRSVKRCKRCKEEQRTEAEQLACASRLPEKGKIPFFFARAAAAMAAAAILVVAMFNGAIINPGYQFRHASEIAHCNRPIIRFTAPAASGRVGVFSCVLCSFNQLITK